MENKEERIDKEKIRKMLSAAAEKLEIIIVDETGSTNDEVKKIALTDEKREVLFIASHQTQGRGRKGRSFFSPKGTGIYMSLLIYPDFTPEECMLVTPMCAVALSEAVEKVTGVKADIKWVNDIFVSGKKVAGILTEGAFYEGKAKYVIIGAGINLAAPEAGFPSDISDIAGSLTVKGTGLKNQLIAECVNRITYYLSTLRERTFLQQYRERLFFLGDKVTVVSACETYEAVAVDVDSECKLKIRLECGEERFLDSGEISIKMT